MANFKSINIRKHDIQYSHIHIRMLTQLVQCLLTGTGLDHIVAGTLQIDHHKAADIDFIFHNQNFFHNSTSFIFQLRS